MSLLKLYAAQNKDLGLVDLRKKVLDSRITYTRTGTKAYYNKNGVMQFAAADVWPREYDPATGECYGRSIWPQATNLCLYSEDLTGAAWGLTRATVSADVANGMDGALTADKLVEDTSVTTTHFIQQLFSFTSGVSYTFSAHFATAGRDVRLTLPATAFGASQNLTVNLTTGAYVTGGTAVPRVTNLGGGRYRISITATATATVAAAMTILLIPYGSSQSYTGDGVSGIYVWGAQMETGLGMTPYIPTTTATVTRGADNASATPASVGYSDTSGTIWAEVMRHHNDGSASGVIVAGASNAEYNALRATGGGGLLGVTLSAGATTGSVPVIAAPWYDLTWTTAAYSYAVNDFRGAAEGTLGTADASGALPTLAATSVWIGRIAGTAHFNGWIRRFRIMRRLTDTELAEATS